MALHQFNFHVTNTQLPQGWIPDKRFIHYEYKPWQFPEYPLPQDLVTVRRKGEPPNQVRDTLAASAFGTDDVRAQPLD